MLASAVPQGALTDPGVAGWRAAHPLAAAVAGVFGMHRAYSAPLFLLAVALLSLSTAICAWRRTGVARKKAALLAATGAVDAGTLAERHDLVIEFPVSLSDAEALGRVSSALKRVGLPTRRTGGLVWAASPRWTVWGSPVFHWALLALVLVVAVGNLFRSSGQIGLAVGQSAQDLPASYGSLNEGPLHRWSSDRTIRLDGFDLTYRSNGINRGPTPTVSVLDGDGRVLASQKVYPNHTLKIGSLTIYPADYGFAAELSFTGLDGRALGSDVQLIDFSGSDRLGTRAVRPSAPRGGGPSAVSVRAAVPLDRVDGGLAGRLPEDVRAHVTVESAAGTIIAEQDMAPGSVLSLPTGERVTLDRLGYYARLQLVDDPFTPALYAALIVAVLGLAVASVARQYRVVAAVVESPSGRYVAVRCGLWRGVTTTVDEIRGQLVSELDCREGGAQ